MRILVLTLILVAQLPFTAAAATCSGADPAITSVKVTSVAHNLISDKYTLTGVVTNLGAMKQSGNVLQVVDISLDGQRLDQHTIEPLAPGQSQSFEYQWRRAIDAGLNTTTMNLHLRFIQPNPPGNENCNTQNDAKSVTF